MKKALFFLFCLLSASLLCAESHVSKIDVQRGERWWGVFAVGGPAMPFETPFTTVNLASFSASTARTTPFLVSSRGRYIWSKEPFSISFNGDSFYITSPVEQVKAVAEGRNLREAYLICCHKHFPPDGKIPAMELFTRPVYHVASALGFEPDAVALRDYADRILNSGYPAGTLVIPAGWQVAVGDFTPDPHRYGDFGALVSDLHGKGFRVMLTVTPYVSGDGAFYRAHRHDGFFVRDASGSLVTVGWEGGYSGLYDLTKEPVASLLRERLDALRGDYGVDGFLFDCRQALDVVDRAGRGGAQRYLENWSALGRGYEFCQYTTSLLPGFDPHIHSLDLDMPFGWELLRAACAQMISANLLGYPYLSVDIDPQRLPDHAGADRELFLRGIQLSLFFPVMQVQFAPWQLHDNQLAQTLKEAVSRRAQMADYYEALVRESARTAEPLLRHMEYEFPRNGFSDCRDQFMLGSRYMVAPLLGEGNSRTVRFPRGTWVDFDGKTYKGPLVAAVTSRSGHPLIFQKIK